MSAALLRRGLELLAASEALRDPPGQAKQKGTPRKRPRKAKATQAQKLRNSAKGKVPKSALEEVALEAGLKRSPSIGPVWNVHLMEKSPAAVITWEGDDEVFGRAMGQGQRMLPGGVNLKRCPLRDTHRRVPEARVSRPPQSKPEVSDECEKRRGCVCEPAGLLRGQAMGRDLGDESQGCSPRAHGGLNPERRILRQNRGRKACDRPVAKTKKKKAEGTVFTEEDFQKFQQEYFGS
ncbi:hypothetical protein P7K49_002458 [Saguinus oedipus]|uniref:Active regulator of SIRT1 n=1 Tax=Saguinus oedipus TaxID=9490 RepID=A0ABQ9WLC0_SAGOE|nr:hypothetical protein P7K49_002458 [Saguinus oedipus]